MNYFPIIRNFFAILILLSFSYSLSISDEIKKDDTAKSVERGIIRGHRGKLRVDIWVDRGNNSVYFPGDPIRIHFRANKDCYVTIYDIDVYGQESLLFPYYRSDNNFIRGGRTYTIPDRYDNYSLYVSGPAGVEYVSIVASTYLYDLPYITPGYEKYRRNDESYQNSEPLSKEQKSKMEQSAEAKISDINRGIIRRIDRDRDYATDYCRFYIEYPRYYYHPKPPHRYYYNYGFGSLSIDSYPKSSEVYIDGKFYGKTPLFIEKIETGRHELVLKKDGYETYKRDISVYSKDTQYFDPSLKKR